MQKPEPMNRLLQGDVGAGQDHRGADRRARGDGERPAGRVHGADRDSGRPALPHDPPAARRIALSHRVAHRQRDRRRGAARSWPSSRAAPTHLVVGTHALAEQAVAFRELGLVVIDEQHRFGVMQRATLRAKGLHPDVLVMTATPIPRTLALTAVRRSRRVGDPRPAAGPPAHQDDRLGPSRAARRSTASCAASSMHGRQVYVVYPLVEESEKVDLRAATAMAEHLQAEVFPDFTVALLHGRLKQDEKDRVMARSRAATSTCSCRRPSSKSAWTWPNATVMVVEHAERFGLSQLHQLRGRVGRGAHPSTCVLLYQPPLGPGGSGAARRARRDDGRVRDRRARPCAARPGGFLRHAAIRAADAAGGRPAPRPRRDGRSPPRGGGVARREPRRPDARRVPYRKLGRALRPGRCRVRASCASSRDDSRAGGCRDRRDRALRPTSDRLRETLFNVLGDTVAGARVLDGFAGTGALGLEALSRGATHVTFVEDDPAALRVLEANIAALRRSKPRVLSSAAISCARRRRRRRVRSGAARSAVRRRGRRGRPRSRRAARRLWRPAGARAQPAGGVAGAGRGASPHARARRRRQRAVLL